MSQTMVRIVAAVIVASMIIAAGFQLFVIVL